MDFAIKAFSETIVVLRSRLEKQSSGAIRKQMRGCGRLRHTENRFVTVPFHRYLQNFS
ncbi:hypothetical protein [Nostoc sp.]|uniref:hypothetical protein n=1 Tax=Nostoc sp. TaxID=1180 RepID=UPI002FF568EB